MFDIVSAQKFYQEIIYSDLSHNRAPKEDSSGPQYHFRVFWKLVYWFVIVPIGIFRRFVLDDRKGSILKTSPPLTVDEDFFRSQAKPK